MRSLEELCTDVQRLARENPDATKAVVSDNAVYGRGMDAMIAMAKLGALGDYARKEFGIALLIENGPDIPIHSGERDAQPARIGGGES